MRVKWPFSTGRQAPGGIWASRATAARELRNSPARLPPVHRPDLLHPLRSQCLERESGGAHAGGEGTHPLSVTAETGQVDPLGPAWTRFRVRPHVVDGLAWASAKLRTVRGPVGAAWQRDGDHIALQVTVPVGSTALVSVPKLSPDGTTEGGCALWPRGARKAGADGIRDASEDGPWVRFTVSAGRYEFMAKGE
jgi:hypothetical protein